MTLFDKPRKADRYDTLRQTVAHRPSPLHVECGDFHDHLGGGLHRGSRRRNALTNVRAIWSALVALPLLAIAAGAAAGQPTRAEAWTECAKNKTVALILRMQQDNAQRQLVVRLRGESALHPPRLPIDIQLPRVAVNAPTDSSGVGDARWCPAAGQDGECVPVAVSATIYVMGLAEDAEVQGQIVSVGDATVDPANRTVFVGQVRACVERRAVDDHKALHAR
jgi:hypothetical protein